MKKALLTSTMLSVLFASSAASAITREETLAEARAYALHQWRSTSANQTASCSAPYKSLFPADDYVGVPYGWGGWQSLFSFDQQIKQGYGAGAQESDGILSCIAGVDCSGFVSMIWATSRYTTASIPQVAATIDKTALLTGDVFNKASYHVAMFEKLLQNGEPAMIEAVGYNTHFNTFGGWSYVNGYTPRRFSGITGTTAGNPVGTPFNPIVIGTLPFTDSRNTAQSPLSAYDGCGAAPSTPEKGPEYIYKIDVTTPGTLTVNVQDDAATDVDVYLLETLNTTACKARADASISQQVGCGTYWIVADTYGTNASKAGPYTLTVNITPSGQSCGAVAGPPPFQPKGKLGDACAYPAKPNLPHCNPNLGSETCIYGSSSSFCSKACATNADCGDLGTGSCCSDLGKGEMYCLTKSFCSGGQVSGTTPPTTVPSGSSSGSTSGGSSSGGEEPSGEEPGTSSSSGDAPGSDEGEEGAAAAPAAAPGTVTTTGCAVSRGAAPVTSLAGVGLALAALAARRRRNA